MYKIYFFVPKTHVEKVKNAMFAKGAGQIGNYSCCAWQTLGEGQFMPLKSSNPFLGELNKLEKVPEYKVEMICPEKNIRDVIIALKTSHPYEEPAYEVVRIEDF
ncbi:NGG1p interacting factor NIF3 [Fluviispira vulneris]|uniref:NGG1p interacting factor NIF3 n=1 Tax=Fluviispira vulneris TaxID=2763012 RepID=UPI001646234B|nr:NGG1p interacting factor NIF3 [Fluviispira vulneris]